MKTNKKICAFLLVSALLISLFTVSAFAAEKLDQNMSGADMTPGERLEYALQGTVTGMVMVFAVLGLLWGIVALSKVVFYDLPKKKANAENKSASNKAAQAPVQAPAQTAAPVAQPEAQDDAELAAVITAAIAAMIESGDYQNEFVGGFRVVSFKRSSARAWNKK